MSQTLNHKNHSIFLPMKKKKKKSHCRRPTSIVDKAKKPPLLSWTLVQPPAVATAPVHAGPRWRAPLDIYGVCVHAELRVLSLLVEEGRSTFGFMARIWAKF